jgi:hypothetical protein
MGSFFRPSVISQFVDYAAQQCEHRGVRTPFVAERLVRPMLVRRLHVDLMRIFTACCSAGR